MLERLVVREGFFEFEAQWKRRDSVGVGHANDDHGYEKVRRRHRGHVRGSESGNENCGMKN